MSWPSYWYLATAERGRFAFTTRLRAIGRAPMRGAHWHIENRGICAGVELGGRLAGTESHESGTCLDPSLGRLELRLVLRLPQPRSGATPLPISCDDTI